MRLDESAKEISKTKTRTKARIYGEFALLLIIIINSFSVVLILYSNSGVSAVSSVPYALSEVFPILSLGTWTYLFHGSLVLILMILRKKLVIPYLFSFAVGFAFGKMVDVHELWILNLPKSIPWCILYFIIGYIALSFGIALSNRCLMPIVPTDLFPRELSNILKIPYTKVKIPFDIICVGITAALVFFRFGDIRGLGVGTVVAAFTLGKTIGLIENILDRYVVFTTFTASRPKKQQSA